MSYLEVNRGDTEVFTVRLTDENGAPLNLTNLSLTFTAKRRPTDTDAQAVIQKTSTDGIAVVIPAAAGVCTVTLDPEDTAALTSASVGRSLYWDFQVDNGAGTVRTPLFGRLAVRGDMTRTWVETS